MSDPMAEIRASFFIECEELIEAMGDGLQRLEDGETDKETINVVFRAVHSIKGGAGAFGLHALVAFAHQFETALDGVRSGEIAIDADALKLFFQGGDVLADHVRAARDGETVPSSVEEPVLEALESLAGDAAAEEEVLDFQPMALSLDLGDTGAPGLPDIPGLPPLGLPDIPGLPPLDLTDAPSLPPFGSSEPAGVPRRLTIRFTPEPALFESGNEPLYLFRGLRDLGELSVTCRPTRPLADFASFDPMAPCLTWEATLVTAESLQAVHDVFEFVDGICQLEVIEEAAAAPAEPAALPPLVAEPAPAAAEAISEPLPEPAAVLTAPELRAVEPAPAPAPAAEAPSRPAPAQPDPEKAAFPKPTVRVDLERIDRLVNLVGELVINQAMLSQSVLQTGIPASSPAAAGLDEFLQLTRDLQECVMMIRAQPVKSLFQRMSRIVREASAAVGKEVRLRTVGEGTEIDKTVIELLAEPLTHMIRNSVDHGLEKPEARIAAGKGREGLVTLTASHRSGRVVIEIADDGAGIDRERVREIAIKKGLIPADAQLTDGEIDNLLFMPGFSTAAEVSALSGRGVGMDVVKTAIAALGGRITIQSTRGEGTTFSISLPLTLAVLDGMVVRVEGETLVVPLSAIVETLTLKRDDMRALGPHTQVIQVRDTFMPLVDLGTELGYRTPRTDYAGAVVLLIAHEDGGRTALVVDAIEDQRQVVIKGLHDSYGHVRGVAAATILGNGQIALILDPVDLVANASGLTRPASSISLAG